MLTVIRHALMSPITGPVATGVAVALAVTLGLAAHGWAQREAQYEARIAQLTDASDRAQSALRAELTSCRAAGGASGERLVTAAAETATPPARPGAPAASAGARRLLEQQPEGLDACARMESADRAVLSNLKR